MLRLLLDEHISPRVAKGLRRQNRAQVIIFCSAVAVVVAAAQLVDFLFLLRAYAQSKPLEQKSLVCVLISPGIQMDGGVSVERAEVEQTTGSRLAKGKKVLLSMQIWPPLHKSPLS